MWVLPPLPLPLLLLLLLLLLPLHNLCMRQEADRIIGFQQSLLQKTPPPPPLHHLLQFTPHLSHLLLPFFLTASGLFTSHCRRFTSSTAFPPLSPSASSSNAVPSSPAPTADVQELLEALPVTPPRQRAMRTAAKFQPCGWNPDAKCSGFPSPNLSSVRAIADHQNVRLFPLLVTS